jgi:hypothetical protein
MDEDQLFLRPARPPRFDERHLTRSNLEFVMEQIAALPTRRELIRFGVWVLSGFSVAALAALHMWDRYISACGPA